VAELLAERAGLLFRASVIGASSDRRVHAGFARLTVREYRELEAGELLPSWEIVDRIERLFGWPRSFAVADHRGFSSDGSRAGSRT
jgi:hypothetical protein